MSISSGGIFTYKEGTGFKQLLNYPVPLFSVCVADRGSNLWFCFAGAGLGVLNSRTNKLSLVISADEGTGNLIRLRNGIYADKGGMIWIGTKGYGLLTLNYNAHLFHHTDQSSVYSLMESGDGRVMVNSGGYMFKYLNPATGDYEDTIPAGKVSVPQLVDREGRQWFSDDVRLVCFDPLTKEKKFFPLPFTKTNGTYSLVSDVKEDIQGKIWLGTSDGLLCLNENKISWELYRNDPGDRSSLSFNSIFSLCFDPVEPTLYLWIGTNGGGLNRMDLVTGKFKRYSVKDGLPNAVIYGILNDNANNLWMSTNKGLSCFNLAKQSFRNYEVKDGLQGNEFNYHASLRTKKGILFFGGVNGYNYFDPAEITSNPVPPKIVITDLRVRNKSVGINEPNSPLKNTIYLEKKIVLPYEDNMITFEFAALDFVAPERNQYKYKMQGFDKDWVNSGNIHVATYTNLDPGTYTFRVKGSNKDEVWNEEGTSIQLIIIPPWYKTWWFRSLLVLIFASTIYFVYRYRLNQTLKLHAIRNSIAKDLHDEIGSNLSNISIFSEVAQQRKGTANETAPLLQKISEYSHVSMTAMSDIVWMINARNDAFENIISRMRSLAAEVFEAKNYALHLHFDEQLNQLSLNMEQRKNFYLIYKEAINNIAKYAHCKNVWITLKKENTSIILIVKDDGIGFDRNGQNHGNGLYNMQKRAEVLKGKLTVDSATSKGTSVHLGFTC